MGERRASPRPNPAPLPKPSATAIETKMAATMLMQGMNYMTTHHMGLPELFHDTTTLSIGTMLAHPGSPALAKVFQRPASAS